MKKKLNMYKDGTKNVPTEKKWNASGVDSNGKSLRAQGIYPEGEKMPVGKLTNRTEFTKPSALNEGYKGKYSMDVGNPNEETMAQTNARMQRNRAIEERNNPTPSKLPTPLPRDLSESEWQKPSTLSSDMNASVGKSMMGKVVIPKSDKAMMIQELLNKQGYNLKTDGRYGDKTNAAFKNFMKAGESPDQALARLKATAAGKSIMYDVKPLGKTPNLTGNG
jgi:hypothetical protein